MPRSYSHSDYPYDNACSESIPFFNQENSLTDWTSSTTNIPIDPYSRYWAKPQTLYFV